MRRRAIRNLFINSLLQTSCKHSLSCPSQVNTMKLLFLAFILCVSHALVQSTMAFFMKQSSQNYRNRHDNLTISEAKVVNLTESFELECGLENVFEYSVIWSKGNTDGTKPTLVSIGLQIFAQNVDNHYSIERKWNQLYSLTIKDATLTDIGFFECKALIPRGKQKIGLVEVNVRHPPAILKASPQLTIGTLGQNITLECQTIGYPKPDIYWTFTKDKHYVLGS